MSDLKQGEVTENKKREHYRFISVEDSEKEAEKICEKLAEAGFQGATFQRKDNAKWEVFQKFSKTEECLWLLERSACDKCKPEFKLERCNTKECPTKAEIEDVLWKESLNFNHLIDYKLRKLRGEVQPAKEEPGIAS